MSIKFYIQSEKSPAVIYVRVRNGRAVDAKAKTKLLAELKDWNIDKQVPNKKTENGKKLELEISKIKTKVIEAINNNDINEEINSDWLKGLLNPVSKVNSLSDYLIDYIDYYLKVKTNEVKACTLQKYRVNQEWLKRFELHRKKKILIKEIGELFQMQFDEYSTSVRYGNNTIARCIKFIKSVCNHAKNNGIETHPQLHGLKKSFQETTRVSLTEDEIQSIYNVELKEDYLSNARDWLIISCETGQRVSDLLRFDKSMIFTNKKVQFLHFTQHKGKKGSTPKPIIFPLTEKIKSILKIRNGEFPRKISSQKYNKYIKLVSEKAGVNTIVDGGKKDPKINRKITGKFEKFELVTSHIGRRSFATNNYGKTQTSNLMYATGHSTEKQFYEYVGKKPIDIAHQLHKYLEDLEK